MSMSLRFILLLVFTQLLQLVCAQSTPKIRQLEKERNELHRRIDESETLLQSTGKDVKSQLENLALISGQIAERRRYLSAVQRDVNTIQQEINRLKSEMKVLDEDLKQKRLRYENRLNIFIVTVVFRKSSCLFFRPIILVRYTDVCVMFVNMPNFSV